MQLTYLPHGQPKTSSEEEGRKTCRLSLPPPAADRINAADGSLFSDTRKEGPSLLLVLKWGGELTPAGRVQAEELGRAFRCMYPGGQGETPPLVFVLPGPGGRCVVKLKQQHVQTDVQEKHHHHCCCCSSKRPRLHVGRTGLVLPPH